MSRERLRRAAEEELRALRDLGVEFLAGAFGRPSPSAAPPSGEAPCRPRGERLPAAAKGPSLFDPPPRGDGTPPRDPATLESVASELDAIAARVRECRLCEIGCERRNAVPGEGPPGVDLLFVGEAPGADEDAQGRPFVGRAGQLLTKMIEAIRLRREDVFIANVLKCRPPENRPPRPEEISNCFPYLAKQIALLRPKVICTLGLHATQTVLATRASMGQLRGRVFASAGAQVVPTYHPAYLLRSPGEKGKAWEDLKLIARLLGKPVD